MEDKHTDRVCLLDFYQEDIDSSILNCDYFHVC